MSEPARDETRDRIDDLLDGRLAALRPDADRLRAALLRGEQVVIGLQQHQAEDRERRLRILIEP